MGKNELEFEQRVTSDQVAALLEDMASGLRSGFVRISTADKSIMLNPASVVKVELEASKHADKQEVSLEISWHVSDLRAMVDPPGLVVTPSNVSTEVASSELD